MEIISDFLSRARDHRSLHCEDIKLKEVASAHEDEDE